jgi:hypothetical protein
MSDREHDAEHPMQSAVGRRFLKVAEGATGPAISCAVCRSSQTLSGVAVLQAARPLTNLASALPLLALPMAAVL